MKRIGIFVCHCGTNIAGTVDVEPARFLPSRHDPDDPGSILHHGVPMAVMYSDYGCDDMAWLLETSDRPHTVRVEGEGRVWHLPLGRFDNREDLTTFIRDDLGHWQPADVAKLRAGMEDAFRKLHEARQS